MGKFDPITVQPEDFVEGFQASLESQGADGVFGFDKFRDGALYGAGVASHAGQSATLGEVIVKLFELHDPSEDIHPAFIMGAVHAANVVLAENQGVRV